MQSGFICICLAMLAGCAATAPDKNEVKMPARLGVSQQPVVAEGDARSIFVLCADCPGPTSKTPVISGNEPVARHTTDINESGNGPANDIQVAKSEVTKSEVTGPHTLFTAHFAFGTAQLSETDRNALLGLLPSLERRKLSIAGYTDATGPQDFNDWLALRRAQAMKHQLVAHSLHPDDIAVTGHGKCCYQQDNDTTLGRAANRRAEIWFAATAENATSGTTLPANQPGDRQP